MVKAVLVEKSFFSWHNFPLRVVFNTLKKLPKKNFSFHQNRRIAGPAPFLLINTTSSDRIALLINLKQGDL
jgi:hypothetical protein